MIYAFDTYYYNDRARTVCIGFDDWYAEKESTVYSEELEIPSGYESGSFYKRELPCILSLLSKIALHSGDMIIVDGYVTLDDEGKFGLGGHLYERLNEKYPVIGIAKNKFSTADSNRREIYRGDSKKPLYLTTKGINVDEIALRVKSMHGEFRTPTLLKRLDQLTRI